MLRLKELLYCDSFASTASFCWCRKRFQCPENWDILVDERSACSHPFPGARLVSQFGKGLAGICLQIPPPPPLHEVTPKLSKQWKKEL